MIYDSALRELFRLRSLEGSITRPIIASLVLLALAGSLPLFFAAADTKTGSKTGTLGSRSDSKTLQQDSSLTQIFYSSVYQEVLSALFESHALKGMDSLLSIVQMPAGIPVGTVAIGRSGAINAALLAASVLALSDPAIATALDAWRARQTDAVADAPTPGPQA